MGSEEPKAIGQGDCAALPLPTPEAIRTQLGSILASPEFQLPERGRAFLRYIVEESLAGRAKRIKAYSIAIEVFGRDEGITPDDPVVRIEAARLRRALERYYLVAGQSDPIRIDIPKGSYVPVFASRVPVMIESNPVEGALQTENERKLQSLESLARVLKNGLATDSDRQRRLIQYLVTEELEGRGHRLKAVSIATDVFGRSADFDPQTDSIIRVEMERIRQALDLYYATQGANDPVRIQFEKDSYRPKFEWIAKGAPVRTPKRLWLLITAVLVTVFAGGMLFVFLPLGKLLIDRQAKPISPRVAVATIAFSSDTPGLDYLVAGMQGELVGILAEFNWLTVFPILADQPIDKAFSSMIGRVDYIVRNTAQAVKGKLAVWTLLTDGKTGAVLWSNRYETPLEAAGIFDLQRNIAARIASDIGRPRGIIASLEYTRIANDSFRSSGGIDCYLRAFRFSSTFDRADYREAHACAEAASKTNDANALALFAVLELAGESFGYNGAPSSERRAMAVRLADQAFRLNDLGSLPRMASYAAAICEGDEERFRRISGLSVRDYPNNPAVQFDVAQRTILGTSAEGIALLERAHKLNPVSDSSYGVLKAFDAFQHSQDDETILNALNLGSATLSPSLQVIEMALRAHVGDQNGAERMRRSLQVLGFTQLSDYLDLIDRECWTKEVKKTIQQLFATN
jgi:adenylate cyclase